MSEKLTYEEFVIVNCRKRARERKQGRTDLRLARGLVMNWGIRHLNYGGKG